MTINANDKVMAKLSVVDFDGEGVKALNKPWGKTPRHRDFVKMCFDALLNATKVTPVTSSAFCSKFTYN